MAIIRLTDKCNQRCLFCNYQEILPAFSLADIKNKLVELRRQDSNVTFSGGEPTLYPFVIL
ncbi:MAG: radical SAM protein [Candidatus Parcubacteria bacterium]|nr:radical SAM protein [Candidatus Parcubacteria bacterium]